MQQNVHENGSKAFDEPIFEARLEPYRSLSKAGQKLVLAFVGLVIGVQILAFFALGAWPVIGFLGLDLLLIYWAFKHNAFSAKAFEEVSVSRSEILVKKFDPKGKETAYSFNPFWVRFRVERKEEIGIMSMAIESRGKRLNIGSFLNPVDQESFARAFRAAMADAQR